MREWTVVPNLALCCSGVGGMSAVNFVSPVCTFTLDLDLESLNQLFVWVSSRVNTITVMLRWPV